MAEERIPGYMAYLPANVRYDPELVANAKLIYAEITSLAEASGYCFARNDYFARLFSLAVKSVSRLISQLAEKGYVTVEVMRDPETSIVLERRIWIAQPSRKKEVASPQDCGDPSPQNCGDPPHREEGTPPRTIAEENDISSFNDIPPISPKKKRRGTGLPAEVTQLLSDYMRDKPPELGEALESFMEVRDKRKAVNTVRPVKTLLSELERLSGGNDALRLALVKAAVLNGWKSVYPLKESGAPPGGSAKMEEGAWI